MANLFFGAGLNPSSGRFLEVAPRLRKHYLDRRTMNTTAFDPPPAAGHSPAVLDPTP